MPEAVPPAGPSGPAPSTCGGPGVVALTVARSAAPRAAGTAVEAIDGIASTALQPT